MFYLYITLINTYNKMNYYNEFTSYKIEDDAIRITKKHIYNSLFSTNNIVSDITSAVIDKYDGEYTEDEIEDIQNNVASHIIKLLHHTPHPDALVGSNKSENTDDLPF